MSKQYRKNKNKRPSRRNKPDSRTTVEESMDKILSADGGYTLQEGDSVLHINHTMYGVGKVMSIAEASRSASVYWPRRHHTTVQGFHLLRKKKENSRVHAVATNPRTKHVIMSDGTRVEQAEFEAELLMEHHNSPEEPTPKFGTTSTAFVDVTVAYPSPEEESDCKRVETLSDDEKKKLRSDPDAFQIGEEVVHVDHKAFGLGNIVSKIQFPADEYRWAVKWSDGSATKMHAANYLVKWPNTELPEENHTESAKHSDPNRAFREYKSRKRYFGVAANRCVECGVDLPNGGYKEPFCDKQWCYRCYRTLRGPAASTEAKAIKHHRSPGPATRAQEKPATAKQLRIIAELSVAKRVTSVANMLMLTFSGAVDIIDEWSRMFDFSDGYRQSEVSEVQKKVIASFEKRLGMRPMPKKALNLFSAEQASRHIEKMQRALDEAR